MIVAPGWHGLVESRMRGNAHVRFGGRAEETERSENRNRASVRPYLANRCLDQVRRRVQNETLGHRGRKRDPLYRIRKVMLKGAERLDGMGVDRMLRGLRAGDPDGDVLGAWLAKESVRDVYLTEDPADAEVLLDKAIEGCRTDWVDEIRSLGGTLTRWRTEILNHHATGGVERADRRVEPPESRRSNAPATASGHSATTGCGYSCTPAASTGPRPDPDHRASEPALPTRMRRATYCKWSASGLADPDGVLDAGPLDAPRRRRDPDRGLHARLGDGVRGRLRRRGHRSRHAAKRVRLLRDGGGCPDCENGHCDCDALATHDSDPQR